MELLDRWGDPSGCSILNSLRTTPTTLTAADYTARSYELFDEGLRQINKQLSQALITIRSMYEIHADIINRIFLRTGDRENWRNETLKAIDKKEERENLALRTAREATHVCKRAHLDRLALELTLTEEAREVRDKQIEKQRIEMAERGYCGADGKWRAIPLSAILDPTKEVARNKARSEEVKAAAVYIKATTMMLVQEVKDMSADMTKFSEKEFTLKVMKGLHDMAVVLGSLEQRG